MHQHFILTFFFLQWIQVCLCRVTTEQEFAVLEGRSLTIPCHYEPQYAGYVKYWCRGRMKEFCTSLARTDEPRTPEISAQKVMIYDDPVQLVFSVTMTQLKEDDSGWYMCGVEIGGIWSADLYAFTNIKVIHGMSVLHSRLTGEEGSSVMVECFYSEKYRESPKKWCRSGDWSSCLLTDSEGAYTDTSVDIRDDRSGAFAVTYKRLQMRDTGWYWCGAGQQQVAVHLQVLPRIITTTVMPVTTSSTENVPQPITNNAWNTHSYILGALLVCAAFLLILGFAIFARRMWKLHKNDTDLGHESGLKVRFNDYSEEMGEMQASAVVFLNKNSQSSHML
ncbi:polymeric immunoglobulin receptor isoform X2 [Boleophthalmus pectinirostris]|uniref:polymeric immunoglobulin receptor isoform X2 n=1 Tax=Boleophthalmus pectinirostris TaxID=150288 RepID=UPI000A1C3045|nr:polymeric immunoglobulin receptor isoform X2 [Boleophthalmus pectinirostris]